MSKILIDEAVVRQALEYLQDNQHLIADNERHAYVMMYNAFIERFEQAIAWAEKQQALDKKADNARELGLDYMEGSAEQYEKELEQPAPAHCEAGPGYCQQCKAEQPAQQEPIAYAVYHRMGGGKSLHWPEQHSENGDHSEYQLVPLYATPPSPAQPCKYGNEPASCISSPMDCQCALDSVFEQPAQEPVAWGIIASNTGRLCMVELDADEVAEHNPKYVVPLYTTPPAPAQEPYGWKVDGYIDLFHCEHEAKAAAKEINSFAFPLYTTPQPPAPAQPLTDEQILEAFCAMPNVHQFFSAYKAGVRFAEAAHGITKGGAA
jgi:hypothetical protein